MGKNWLIRNWYENELKARANQMSKTKHASRLPSYGQGAPRWIANQIYTRMLLAHQDIIPLISVAKFGTKVPDDINIGSAVHSEPGGIVYFNEDGGGVFILVKESGSQIGPYDGNELDAGQVGPMGDM